MWRAAVAQILYYLLGVGRAAPKISAAEKSGAWERKLPKMVMGHRHRLTMPAS